MYSDCYLRKNIVYIPTMEKTVDGIYVASEPIAVVPVDNTDELQRAFRETFSLGNPIVPRVDFRKDKRPDVRQYAGVKTWAAFERGTTAWSIAEKEGVYDICICRRHRDGGWIDDLDQKVTFPPGTNIDEVCARIVEIIQAKARE